MAFPAPMSGEKVENTEVEGRHSSLYQGHKSASSPCSPAQAPCSVSLSGMCALPTFLFSSRLSSDVCGGNEPLHSLNAKR